MNKILVIVILTLKKEGLLYFHVTLEEEISVEGHILRNGAIKYYDILKIWVSYWANLK